MTQGPGSRLVPYWRQRWPLAASVGPWGRRRRISWSGRRCRYRERPNQRRVARRPRLVYAVDSAALLSCRTTPFQTRKSGLPPSFSSSLDGLFSFLLVPKNPLCFLPLLLVAVSCWSCSSAFLEGEASLSLSLTSHSFFSSLSFIIISSTTNLIDHGGMLVISLNQASGSIGE